MENTKKILVVKVHEPNTRFSLALEGLKLVEVKFCKREKKSNNHCFEALKVQIFSELVCDIYEVLLYLFHYMF
jgi:hypothetical protein